LDAVGRWGDHEFLAVVSNATGENLEPIAERIRMLVEASYLTTATGPFRATVSVGAVAATGGREAADVLLKQAEACVYRSKAAGRNRVTLHPRAAQQL
jgi:diguanylate cyclase (GGDEF)-like protein